MPARSCLEVLAREKIAALSRPALTRWSRAGPGRTTLSTASATVSGSLSSSSTPVAAEGFGDGRGSIGDHRHAEFHRLQDRDAKTFVLGEANEDVGHRPVGQQLGPAEPVEDLDAVPQFQLVHHPLEGSQIVRRRRAADEGKACSRVEHPAINGKRPDHIVLALVGSDPPDEQPLRPGTVAAPAQPVKGRLVRRPVVLLEVDQERADDGLRVAAFDQLGGVVARVREGKRDMRVRASKAPGGPPRLRWRLPVPSERSKSAGVMLW